MILVPEDTLSEWAVRIEDALFTNLDEPSRGLLRAVVHQIDDLLLRGADDMRY